MTIWIKQDPVPAVLGIIGFFVVASVILLPISWLKLMMGYACAKALGDQF
jgi:hypothetical protein